jgi:hypothetical protein
MFRKSILFLFLLLLTAGLCRSQAFIKTADLFQRPDGSGKLSIYQNPAVDTLLSRYILAQKKLNNGIWGFRIQIYYNSVRTAREESARARAEFISKFPEENFPDLKSYAQYQPPGWYMIRVGDFRTRAECYKYLVMVRKEFPNAYVVKAVISFPDLIKK